jgi:AraC-like DNA-binding protein
MEGQPKQFVLSLIAYAVQRGVSAKQLCEHSNIDLSSLAKKSPETITVKQMNDLWRNASHLCHDPLFGLHFGESLQLAALGAVGEIIKNSNTVGEAIAIASSLVYQVTDLFKMNVTKGKKTFIIQLIPTHPDADDFVSKQIADFLMVFTTHELNGFLLEKIVPYLVTYPYKTSAKEYERVFHISLKKGIGYSIELKNHYWDLPILTANYELQKFFLEKINKETGNPLTLSISFQVKILDYLMKNSYLGILSLEDVAANFNITSRTLQRKLQEEGTTFQQLADSARKSLAIYFLESGKYQVKEISNMLGYNELSAFSRAFKRWTGKTPVTYQA